ncbi:PREDICTED: uncharacterized protein C7orf73-like [Elephantulus edwardii]|uniref:uncharacterized protein C7orf73-like n=1 Tax=Elephantulus edwardii TaxID=28737 RepID=UPI0003F0AEF6|nr:PREDICTED: uncharacterized protein C7orf73-like [Elephantulus edwardii]
MLQFLLGLTFGNIVGVYLPQNYEIPNLAKKLDNIKKDLDAKKKPPSLAIILDFGPNSSEFGIGMSGMSMRGHV